MEERKLWRDPAVGHWSREGQGQWAASSRGTRDACSSPAPGCSCSWLKLSPVGSTSGSASRLGEEPCVSAASGFVVTGYSHNGMLMQTAKQAVTGHHCYEDMTSGVGSLHSGLQNLAQDIAWLDFGPFHTKKR